MHDIKVKNECTDIELDEVTSYHSFGATMRGQARLNSDNNSQVPTRNY